MTKTFSLVGAGSSAPSADVSAGTRGPGGGAINDPGEEKLVDFVSFVLDDAQATWKKLMPTLGGRYVDAKLHLFRDGVDSACGYAQGQKQKRMPIQYPMRSLPI